MVQKNNFDNNEVFDVFCAYLKTCAVICIINLHLSVQINGTEFLDHLMSIVIVWFQNQDIENGEADGTAEDSPVCGHGTGGLCRL